MKNNKSSLIIQVSKEGNIPLGHELKTLYFLHSYYKTEIVVLAPNRVRGQKTPDIKMLGVYWEIKSPKGIGKHTIMHCIKAASRQCENIIVDLRRLQGSYRRYISTVEREFANNRRLRRLKVITKSQQVIDFNK